MVVGAIASLPLLFVCLAMAQDQRRGVWGIATYRIAAMVALVMWGLRNNRFTTIVPEYRGASRSFWKRNRDTLIITLIGIGLSSAVAVAVAILDF